MDIQTDIWYYRVLIKGYFFPFFDFYVVATFRRLSQICLIGLIYLELRSFLLFFVPNQNQCDKIVWTALNQTKKVFFYVYNIPLFVYLMKNQHFNFSNNSFLMILLQRLINTYKYADFLINYNQTCLKCSLFYLNNSY